MKVLVDADACPVKNIIVSISKKYKIPVIMIADTCHNIDDGYSEVITVDKSSDSADFVLVNMIKKEDIVVTQDFGLAAMCLAKGARVINQNGLLYTNDNIDKLLFERHIGQKVRRGGGRTKGPSKRIKDDNIRFENTFLNLLL
ncbi:UNVERIFIED_CONTAM: hypothetical protein Cloal_3091 [Acetivibrio alkalicellulosi]